jgi:hypothetical protein
MNRIISLTLALALFYSMSVYGQEGGNLVQPKVWLKVNADSLLTGTWKDGSGNGHHATLSNGTSGLTYFNFNPARKFSDQNGLATIPYSIEGLSEITFMSIYKASDTTERGFTGTIDGLTRNIKITTNQVLGPDSIVDVFPNSGALVTLNTIAQTWEDTDEQGEGAALSFAGVNNASIERFDGSIAEFLVFDQMLPFIDRIKWETYLAIKYGVTLNGKNYVSSGEQVLWHAKDNSAYSNRITGIGRDDVFGLNQKQSVSAQDTTHLLLLTIGKAAENNAENTSALSDQNFIVWGDNDQTLTSVKGDGADSILTIVERKWLLQANGTGVQNLASSIQVDFKQLPYDSLGYWLVNDRSGSSNFSVDNLEYIEPDSISTDSLAFFNNLSWDTDLSGKDNFAFANVQPLFVVARTLEKPLCTDPKTGKILIEVIKGTGPFQIDWGLLGTKEKTNWQSTGKLTIEKLMAGTYTLKVRDAGGNTFERLVVLELANGIPIDLGADQTLQDGQEITLDASTGIPDSLDVEYFWESSFGFRSTKAKVSITESGIYRVYATNKANGCVFGDEVVFSGSPIQRIEVFPNPIRHDEPFNLSISLKEAGELEVKLFDLKGNLFDTLEGTGQSEYQFQIKLPTTGQFMIVVETPEGRRTKKIIVY